MITKNHICVLSYQQQTVKIYLSTTDEFSYYKEQKAFCYI